MDKDKILNYCANDLKMFGRYDIGSDENYLPLKMLRALREIWGRHPWSWKLSTATVSTTSGNLGGYALPFDFDLLTIPEKISRVYSKDSIIFPRVLDSNGDAVDCYVRRSDNTLFFTCEPSTAEYTLYYIPKFDTLTQISLFPEDMCDLVVTLTKSFALEDDIETAQMQQKYRNDFEYKMLQYWNAQRKGQSLNSARVPISQLNAPYELVLRYDGALN